MDSGQLKFEKQDGVGVITLDRPESRNALTPAMVGDMAEALESCRGNDVRSVLITGSGDAFCAGGDVKEMVSNLEQGGPEALSHHIRTLADALHLKAVIGIRRLEKPVIACVNGVAAGAGFSLMLACDLRIASANARFFMAYANIGATADGGSTHFLPRLVGNAKAMELYLATEPIGAERALELGLVSQVWAPEELFQRSMETATRLAQGPTLAYGRVKALFDQSWELSLEQQLNEETDAIASIGLTQDFQEGVRAFAAKRRPRFQGK